jgi:hypothetical protein
MAQPGRHLFVTGQQQELIQDKSVIMCSDNMITVSTISPEPGFTQ